MKITLDLKGSSASAITTTLEVRRDELLDELAAVESALRQLKAFEIMSMPERGEVRLRHGEAEEAIYTYLKTVVAQWGAPIEQIIDHLKIPRTTTYRVLKSLQAEQKVVLATNRHWVALAFPGVETGAVLEDLSEDTTSAEDPGTDTLE